MIKSLKNRGCMTAVAITVTDISKRFCDVNALCHVTVAIQPGELFFLLGPSGCGKTTLLRTLAGFCVPDVGQIYFDQTEVTHLPPNQRNAGLMFQSYALWPHMTLAENVAFGLEMRGVSRAEIRTRVRHALERVRMADRAKARPNQLSGGEQQRVALARALVIEPQCLLLDEPLSNLDAKLRLEMRLEIRRICKQAGITAIYVTHDQKEALSIADRMAVMRAGCIEQIGTPEDVYSKPINRFVAGFIGEANFIEGWVQQVASNGVLRIETHFGVFFSSHTMPPDLAVNEKVVLCLRPEAVSLGPPLIKDANVLKGVYRQRVYLGEVAQHEIDLMPLEGGDALSLKVFELNPCFGRCQSGETVVLWISPEQVIVARR